MGLGAILVDVAGGDNHVFPGLGTDGCSGLLLLFAPAGGIEGGYGLADQLSFALFDLVDGETGDIAEVDRVLFNEFGGGLGVPARFEHGGGHMAGDAVCEPLFFLEDVDQPVRQRRSCGIDPIDPVEPQHRPFDRDSRILADHGLHLACYVACKSFKSDDLVGIECDMGHRVIGDR